MGSDFGILSQEPCGPPCFQGIRPGVTPYDDAKGLLLKYWGQPCNALLPMILVCESGGVTIWITYVETLTGHEIRRIVSTISLRPAVKITVSDLIAQYGPPDLVVPAIESRPSEEHQRSDMLFYYGELQTSILLAEQPGQTYTVTPDTMIRVVGYMATADYSYAFSQISYFMTRGQPWYGYGTYTPKLNTQP